MKLISIEKCREYVREAYNKGCEDAALEEESPDYAEERRRLITEQAQQEWEVEHDYMARLEAEMEYYGYTV